MYIGSINDIEVGLDILLKSESGKKKSTHLNPVSLFLRPGSFVLYWSQGGNQKVAYSLWNGIPVTGQEAVQPC